MIYFEAIYILLYLFFKKIQYILGKSRYSCINNIATFLSNKNIMYTKCFQSLSTSSNILDNNELSIFKKFTDNVSYNKDDLYDINIIIKKLNEKSKNKIILFSDIPYKSGVIAVVYKGKIDNKDVIIKVIRKNIKKKLHRSLKVFDFILNIFNCFKLFKLYDLKSIFQENKNDIINQLNFNKEIENNKIMYNNFKNIDYIKIPYVYDEFTKINNNIIIMEKINGMNIHEITDSYDKNKFFNIFNKFIFKSIIFNRTYHADLHPGNIFFNKINNEYQIGIIDFGLVGNITKSSQNDLFKFFKYIVIDKDIEQSTILVINNLIDSKEHYDKLSLISQKNIILSINKILEDIIINNKHIDLDFIYNTNKLLNKYNLKLSRIFCKVEMAIAVGGCISKYLSTNSNDNQIYYNNLKEIINEIINPKILDLE